jgi:gliding motility-associated lipoprotein GldB
MSAHFFKHHRFFFFTLLFLLFSCSEKNRFSKVDLSGVTVAPVQIQRFDRDFFAINTDSVASSLAVLQEKYGRFLDLYISQIIGNPSSEEETVRRFLTHPVYREFYSDCETKYADVSDLEAGFTAAFKGVKYYFPDIPIPDVYTHVSGFGDIIVVDEGLISVSLDYYLGADYKNYEYVDGIHSYMLPNMRREKIVSDAVFWWLTTEFSDNIDAPKLLDNMMYYGKIMYLTELFLPDEKEENLIGYSRQQWNWCRANESKMWNYMIENRHIFSTEVLLTAKYINPAPFTSYFTEESPGRTGIWIGWQIIRSYMNKNKDVTLHELMNNFNAQDILEKSGYRP